MKVETGPGPHDKPEVQWASQAVLDVIAERRRQIEGEGWTQEHDDSHAPGEMAEAASVGPWFEPRSGSQQNQRLSRVARSNDETDIRLRIRRAKYPVQQKAPSLATRGEAHPQGVTAELSR